MFLVMTNSNSSYLGKADEDTNKLTSNTNILVQHESISVYLFLQDKQQHPASV